MSAMDDLYDEWKEAPNGFDAGVDFKVWLAISMMQLRQRIAALESAIDCFMNRIDTLPWSNSIDGEWVGLNANVWKQFNYQDCEQLRLAAHPAPMTEQGDLT